VEIFMSNTNTGGPAFPHEYFDKQLNQGRVMHGMTLRDFFAAKAMQGYVARGKAYDFEDIAKASYRVADAMLKARDV
jgi:hypothetical protein